MRVSMIVAMAENRTIGLDGAMPWHLSADLKYFKKVTMGAPVLMGRKTYDSIGRALPGRANIIVTRDRDYKGEGIEAVHNLEAGLNHAREIAKRDGKDEVFVIGGAQIYELALPLADRIYATEIHQDFEGDAAFPVIDQAEWHEISRELQEPETDDNPSFSFVVWDRRH